MHINYIVVGFDNEKRGFLDQINNKCTVLFENNPSSVSSITKGNYPCFVLSSKNKIHKTWTSSDFGFRSLDVIEEFFEDN